MTQDTDFKTLLEEYCMSVEAFERVLSVLLVTAHGNGIDVSGGWEACENDAAPEWDVVVTPLERAGSTPPTSNETSVDGDDAA